ncbi:SEM3E protein, partial [Polypterus senegalus]
MQRIKQVEHDLRVEGEGGRTMSDATSQGGRVRRWNLWPGVRGSKELWELNRTTVFYGPRGFLDLKTMLLDEYQERLFVGGRDVMYSLNLEKINDEYKENECANFIRLLQQHNRTHMLACGTGAFSPVCAFVRVGHWRQNDVGGRRVLVNKWTSFLKTQLICSVPGPNGIDTYFDELGYAVCIYHMAAIREAFNGPYAHKEGPEYHWTPYEGKIPFPRPGTCASKMNGGQYSSSKDYPDDVVRFVRSHPLMYQSIFPTHKKPVLLKTDGKYNLKQIVADRVEAEDGQYNVLFLGTEVTEKAEGKIIYGIENNSTLLDCIPRSLQAKVLWFTQSNHDERKEEVKPDERVLKTDHGLLFLKLQKSDAGTYICQTVEHGFVHTVTKITLEILEVERIGEMFQKDDEEEMHHKVPCFAPSGLPQGSSKLWYKDFLQLIGYNNFQRVEEYCERVWCTDKKRKKHRPLPPKWKYPHLPERRIKLKGEHHRLPRDVTDS